MLLIAAEAFWATFLTEPLQLQRSTFIASRTSGSQRPFLVKYWEDKPGSTSGQPLRLAWTICWSRFVQALNYTHRIVLIFSHMRARIMLCSLDLHVVPAVLFMGNLTWACWARYVMVQASSNFCLPNLPVWVRQTMLKRSFVLEKPCMTNFKGNPLPPLHQDEQKYTDPAYLVDIC